MPGTKLLYAVVLIAILFGCGRNEADKIHQQNKIAMLSLIAQADELKWEDMATANGNRRIAVDSEFRKRFTAETLQITPNDRRRKKRADIILMSNGQTLGLLNWFDGNVCAYETTYFQMAGNPF